MSWYILDVISSEIKIDILKLGSFQPVAHMRF